MEELEKWVTGRPEFVGHRFFRTSGSSGVEKWVALSDRALEWSARSVIERFLIGPDEVLGLALPENHVGGFGVVLRAALAGARLARFEGRWDAGRFATWCEQEGVTITSLVPTQVHDLVERKLIGPKSLRLAIVGGGAFDEELKEQARELGWVVQPSYGMTETSSQVATGDGLPLLSGWEARIENGCLALKGRGLFTAIITKESGGFVSRDPKVEGWYLTTDRAELTDGRLKILGRADRTVKVLGELVNLNEQEEFWREKLACEVALVARPHDRKGCQLILYYEGGDLPNEVGRWNAERPGPERIEVFKPLPKIPRTELGKIDRRLLMEYADD